MLYKDNCQQRKMPQGYLVYDQCSLFCPFLFLKPHFGFQDFFYLYVFSCLLCLILVQNSLFWFSSKFSFSAPFQFSLPSFHFSQWKWFCLILHHKSHHYDVFCFHNKCSLCLIRFVMPHMLNYASVVYDTNFVLSCFSS